MNTTKINKTMLKYILSFVIGILISLPGLLKATHIVGGNMGYNCLGNDEYEIVLDIYRDCLNGAENAPFDMPAYVGVYDQNGLLVQNVVLPFMGDDTLTTSLTDPCLVILEEVCVHTSTYRKTITLSPAPGGYTLAYQRCCRNVTLDNILNPDETGATFQIELTAAAMNRCSSSPQFVNWPPIYVCTDLPLVFDHSAIDVDGDSIVYSLCTPFSGGTLSQPQPIPPSAPPYDTVVWDAANGYGIGNMLGQGTPLSIDPHTGILTAVPGLTGQFVVGVCMEEYDRATGELLSVTNRDFQFNVNLCGERISAIGSPEAQCDNYTVHFVNESLNTTSFEWIFDYPNNTMVSNTSDMEFDVTYPAVEGEYTIRLIAEPGSFCADTSYTTIYLQNNSLDANINVDVFDCDNVAIMALTDLSQDNVSPPVAWNWEVTYNGGSSSSTDQNPVLTLPLNITGTVNFTVTSQNGCVQSLTQTFQTGTGNPANFILDNIQQCVGEVAFLNPNTPLDIGYNYSWAPAGLVSDAHAINPSVTVSSSQVFTVTITPPGNECEIVREVSLVAVENPVLDFSSHLECDGLTVTFTNLSQNAPAYSWDFGDGSTLLDVSNEVNPSYTYPELGTYTVTLKVPDTELCTTTITKEVTISQIDLDVAFSYEYASCVPGNVTVQFTDESINTTGANIINWNWVVTPGGTSTEPNPSFTYNTSQIINVSLTVTTADGCASSMIEENVAVNVIDNADQFPDTLQVCFGGETTLNPGGNPTYTYDWQPNIGIDDNHSASPTFSPASTTNYTVEITSFGADTCSYVEEMVVFVTPEIGLNVSGGGPTCEATATLNATSLVDVDYAWMLNGVQVATGDTYTIDVSGVHDFTLIATDQYGCSETERQTVDVTGGPVNISVPDTVSACLSDGISGLMVTNLDLNDTLTYIWTPMSLFENGTANTAEPDFIESVGEHLVSVLVTNQFGCTEMQEVVVGVIDDNINLSYEYEIDCSGATVAFTNTSTNAFGYIWDFGNGDISYEESPVYTFPMAGTYPVTLSIVFDGNCVVDFTRDIVVQDPQVIADFTYEIASCSIERAEIAFSDQSFTNIAGATIVSWDWTFGDNLTSNDQNPIVFIENTGDLPVTLSITTSNGCTATISKTVDVQIVDLSTLSDTIVMCKGFSTPLNPGGNASYTYEWSPNEFIDDINSPNPTVNPTQTTLYSVTVTTIGSDTCEVTGMVLVYVPDDINVNLGDDVFTCGDGVVLTPEADVDLATVEWTDQAGNVLGGAEMITINPYQNDTVIVNVADEYGCTDSDTINVILYPDVNLQIDGDTTLCEIATVPLWGTTDVDATIDWYIQGSDEVIATGTPIMVTPEEGTNVYVAIATDNETNCKDTSSLIVQVNILGAVGPESTIRVCHGVPTHINPAGQEGLIYEWSPVTNLEFDPNWNPIVTTEEEITYYVTITDPVGQCLLIDTTTIIPYPEINPIASPDTILCEAVAIDLMATSDTPNTTFTWYDNPELIEPGLGSGTPFTVTPSGESTYYVVAEDEFGCTEMDDVTINSFPINADITAPLIICEATESITLEVSNNDPLQVLGYNWMPAGAVTPDDAAIVVADLTQSEDYSVVVTNQFDCQETLETTITVINLLDSLQLTATPDTILLGESTDITANGCLLCDYDWIWPSGDITPEFGPIITATPDEPYGNIYEVTANLLGCTLSDTVSVFVIDGMCDTDHLFLPTAFSPDGDGQNDVYRVRSFFLDQLTEFELVIYSRWGEEVFRSTDPHLGWDGTYKGEFLAPDVYGYYLRTICPEGEEFIQQGNVTLLK